jgi:hypothetical protein
VNRQVYYQCCKHWSLCCLWTLGTATVTATSTTAGTTSTTGTTTTTTPAVCTGTRDLGEVSLNSYSAPNNVQCKFFLTVNNIYILQSLQLYCNRVIPYNLPYNTVLYKIRFVCLLHNMSIVHCLFRWECIYSFV